ncbi:MAG: hypothetical protein AAB473_03555 [Patescibacteria group bacterium]
MPTVQCPRAEYGRFLKTQSGASMNRHDHNANNTGQGALALVNHTHRAGTNAGTTANSNENSDTADPGVIVVLTG